MTNSFVTAIRQNDKDLGVPDWDHLREQLIQQGSGSGDEIVLTGPNEALMIVSCAEPNNYYVIARQSDELGEKVLVDRTKGDEPITAPIAGLFDTYPRFAFVDQRTMLKAAEDFYRNGLRSPSLSWADPRDILTQI